MPLLLQGQLVYSGETIFMLDEHLDGHLGLSSKKAAVPPVQQKASQPRPPTPVRRHCWQPLQPVGQLLQPVGQTPQPAGETPQRALTRAYRSASEDDEDDAAADVNLSDDDAANAAADAATPVQLKPLPATPVRQLPRPHAVRPCPQPTQLRPLKRHITNTAIPFGAFLACDQETDGIAWFSPVFEPVDL